MVLPAVCRMPSLRHLDLGGNNFTNMRNKNQEKLLPNLLMEIVKIINDEDGVSDFFVLLPFFLYVHTVVEMYLTGFAFFSNNIPIMILGSKSRKAQSM